MEHGSGIHTYGFAQNCQHQTPVVSTGAMVKSAYTDTISYDRSCQL